MGNGGFRKCVVCCWLLASCFVLPVDAAPLYNILPLDVLPGGLDSVAVGLNELGQVAGDSRFDRSGHIGQSRAVTWDESGAPLDLWPVELLVGGVALDINNSGVVVGRYGSGAGIPVPGPGVPYGRAFVWDSVNGRRDLGLEPVGNSQAVAVNDAGAVVGTSEVLTIIGTSSFYAPLAFIWDESSGIQSLGTLGGNFSFAADVNASGLVVGYSETAAEIERAFVWDRINGMQDIPTPSTGFSRAVAVNDLGQVLGGGEGGVAFIWDAVNGMQSIPVGGNDINNLGQVVGGFVGDPTIWDATNGSRRLADLILPNSGWNLEIAFAINDAGEIAGYGLFNGEIRGFLMTPVPEPSTALLASLAISFMRRFAMRI